MNKHIHTLERMALRREHSGCVTDKGRRWAAAELEALRAAIAALSHAAGQEAEYPECTGDPKDCPENEGHGCCKTATINTAEIDRKLVGGEAVAPFAWGYLFPHDGETDHCLSMARFLPSWVEAKGATEHPLYLTPAQPPASAEVGRKLMDDLNRIAYGYLPDGDGVDTSVALWAEQTLSRMAASSGRKESTIAGVTHGTDEGWGDLGPQGTHTQRQG